MSKLEQAILNILMGISLPFLIWFFISIMEVNCKNTEPNPEYNRWNAIVVMTANVEIENE